MAAPTLQVYYVAVLMAAVDVDVDLSVAAAIRGRGHGRSCGCVSPRFPDLIQVFLAIRGDARIDRGGDKNAGCCCAVSMFETKLGNGEISCFTAVSAVR